MEAAEIYEKGYGKIPKLVMQDNGLHINSKAIYAYLCSYAGVENRCYPSRKKICSDLGISVDTFTKYLKELTGSGYLTVTQEKEHGKFSRNVYTLCEIVSPCEESPYPKISDTETAVHGQSDTKKNKEKKNSNSKKNSPKRPYAPGFDEFWKAYPKKVAKTAAQKAWDKLKPDQSLQETILQAVNAAKNSRSWTKDNGQYIPHPATWLNGRRWEDETGHLQQQEKQTFDPHRNPFEEYI